MRSAFLAFVSAVLLSLVGCDDRAAQMDAGADAGFDGGVDAGPTELTISIAPQEVIAGTEFFRCLYTTLHPGRVAGVWKWSSNLDPHVAEVRVFFPATVEESDQLLPCANPLGSEPYAYASSTGELAMPAGVAMTVLDPQPVIVRVHFENRFSQTFTAGASVKLHLVPASQTYSAAAAYLSVNSEMSIPAQGNATVTGSCPVPTGARFFFMTARTRKLGVGTEVRDGTNIILQSTDWTDPPFAPWADPPHHLFEGNLGYECRYSNPYDFTVNEGDMSYDETCEVLGYFFPATAPVLCVNSTVVP
jgi:hypothetical protein